MLRAASLLRRRMSSGAGKKTGLVPARVIWTPSGRVSAGDAERIRFHGPLEYMDLPALYRSARVLVAPRSAPSSSACHSRRPWPAACRSSPVALAEWPQLSRTGALGGWWSGVTWRSSRVPRSALLSGCGDAGWHETCFKTGCRSAVRVGSRYHASRKHLSRPERSVMSRPPCSLLRRGMSARQRGPAGLQRRKLHRRRPSLPSCIRPDLLREPGADSSSRTTPRPTGRPISAAGSSRRTRGFALLPQPSQSRRGARTTTWRTSIARGRYFKWLAHDDRLLPGYLEAAAIAALGARPDAVLCNSVVSLLSVAEGQYLEPL